MQRKTNIVQSGINLYPDKARDKETFEGNSSSTQISGTNTFKSSVSARTLPE